MYTSFCFDWWYIVKILGSRDALILPPFRGLHHLFEIQFGFFFVVVCYCLHCTLGYFPSMLILLTGFRYMNSSMVLKVKFMKSSSHRRVTRCFHYHSSTPFTNTPVVYQSCWFLHFSYNSFCMNEHCQIYIIFPFFLHKK